MDPRANLDDIILSKYKTKRNHRIAITTFVVITIGAGIGLAYKINGDFDLNIKQKHDVISEKIESPTAENTNPSVAQVEYQVVGERTPYEEDPVLEDLEPQGFIEAKEDVVLVDPVQEVVEVKETTVAPVAQPEVIKVHENTIVPTLQGKVIQVGAFYRSEPSKDLLDSIKKQQLSYFVKEFNINGASVKKVYIGPFNYTKNRKSAMRIVKKHIESKAFFTEVK